MITTLSKQTRFSCYSFPMIHHLLLDLDNTLYPASEAMDAGITHRMIGFVASYLGVSVEEATALRLAAIRGAKPYGTTLEWLKAEHRLADENAYFEAVHPESEIAELTPDPKLGPYLVSLGLPLTLLTNAPMAHAKRVLAFFGIEDIFLGVFDLTFHNGRGKPHRNSFLDTLKAVGHTVDDTIFVDDQPKYVRGFKALGGRAILVDESGRNAAIAAEEGFGHIISIYGLRDLLTARGDIAINTVGVNA